VLLQILASNKYLMRISEVIKKPIKPKPPMNPAQARIHALQQGVERSREQLRVERERQRQQREAERRRKQMQQR
jgi:uncharacterized protein YneF (UPF0154 family)